MWSPAGVTSACETAGNRSARGLALQVMSLPVGRWRLRELLLAALRSLAAFSCSVILLESSWLMLLGSEMDFAEATGLEISS